jgi:hypothetical protein
VRIFWGVEEASRAKHPVCFIATEWVVDRNTGGPVLEKLLDSGASYFCFSGPNASELHLEADRRIVARPTYVFVPTIGETGGSLAEAAWDFLHICSPPNGGYFDYLVVVFGDERFRVKVARALRLAGPFVSDESGP